MYIELPEEDEMHGKMLGKLKLCLYGTRDAAKGWQETLSAHLETIGFKRGRGHPCVFHHPERDIKTLVHGDDYVSAGSDESMDWLENELAKAYEIGAKNNLAYVEGPVGFSNMEKAGILTSGFEELNTMITWYQYPYYAAHFEQLGYEKQATWVEFKLTIPPVLIERVERFSSIIKKRYDLSVIDFKSK